MGHESKSSGKQGNTENERTQARVNHGKFSRTQLVFWLAQIWLWKHEEETLFILPKLRKYFDLCARMSHKKGTILDTACALVVLVAPVAVEDFASRLRHVSLPRSQSLHRPRSTCPMWELRISLFYFVQAFPSTDSMCSTVSKSLAYPYHTAIEMCSAPFQKQVQTWLWLWVLYCCIWFSWFQVHTASIFLHQVHGYSVCLFLSRMFLFLSQARVPPFPTPPSLCISPRSWGSLAHNLSSIITASCEDIGSFMNSAQMLLQWSLMHSVFNTKFHESTRERHY